MIMMHLQQMQIFAQQSFRNGLDMACMLPCSICERTTSKYMSMNRCGHIRL